MGVFVSDSFTDTDATLLQDHTGEVGATWTKYPGYTGDASINANVLYASSANDLGEYYASGVPNSADCYTQATLVFQTSVANTSWGILGRADHTVSAGQDTYYYIDYNQVGAVWALYKIVAGTTTQLGTFSQADGANHVARLLMVGTTIQALIDSTSQISVTDSAITAAGRAGLYLLSVSGGTLVAYNADDFSAATFDPPPGGGGVFSPFQLWAEEELL